MSAGAFTDVAYRSVFAPAEIYAVRIQPETQSLTVTIAGNAEINVSGLPITDVNVSQPANVGGSRRRRGLHIGLCRFRLVDATELPGNYLQGSVLTLPILNPTIARARRGATGTYQGAAIVVAGVSGEVYR